MKTKPPKKSHSKTIITSLVLVTLLLVVANIVASNTLATSGKKLQTLNQRALDLEKQNQAAEKIIIEKMSLINIETESKKLGLVPITKTLNLTSPEPLAKLP